MYRRHTQRSEFTLGEVLAAYLIIAVGAVAIAGATLL